MFRCGPPVSVVPRAWSWLKKGFQKVITHTPSPFPIRHLLPGHLLQGKLSVGAFQGQSLVQMYKGLFFGVRATKYQGLFQNQVHADPIKTPFILNSMPGQSLD